MSLVTARPIANDNTLWHVYDYTNIDDNVFSPDSGDASEDFSTGTIIADKNDDNEEQIYVMTAPTNSGVVNSITVYYRQGLAVNESTPSRLRVYVNGTPTSYQNITSGITGNNQWGFLTYSGTWSFSGSTVLKVGIDCGVHDSGPSFDVVYLQYDISPSDYSYTATEGVTLSGTAKIGRGYYAITSSQVTIGGYTFLRRPLYYSINSTEPTLAGWAKSGHSYTPTGGITLGDTYFTLGRTYIGDKTSPVSLGGTSIYSILSYQYEATGAIGVAGFAVIGIHYLATTSTQPTLSSVVKIGIGLQGSGGATLSGELKPRIGFRASGGITMSGACVPGIKLRGNGGVTLSGISLTGRRQTATGGIDVSGYAITLNPTSALGSGVATISGTAIFRLNIKFTVGSIEVKTKITQTGTNGGGGSIAWSGLSNITAIDNSFTATSGSGVVTNNTSQFLHATNFDFNVPIQSVGVGLIARLYNTGYSVFAGTGTFQIIEVVLVKNGTRSLYNLAGPEFLTNSLTTDYNYGSNTNTWGESISGSDLDANFGLAIRVNHTTTGGIWGIGIDAVEASLYFYTPVTLSGQSTIGIALKATGGTTLSGTANCIIPSRKYPGTGGPEVAGVSLVKVINPLRHFANGTISIGGSMFLRFNQHTATGGIDISGDSNEGWVYRLRAGQATFTWSDNFNRADNTNIG